MTALPPEIEQADAMLAEAAKLDLVLMRHVQGLALATDEAQEVGTLVHAYARASRCMRQNLALLAKQKADRAKAAREADQHAGWLKARRLACDEPEPEPDPRALAVADRVCDVQDALGRIISHAAAGDRRLHADWVHRFDREMDDWWEEPDFLDFDLDAVVGHACKVLDLPADLARRWRDLPDPDFTPDPAPREARDPERFINWPPHDPQAAPDHQLAPDTPWADSA